MATLLAFPHDVLDEARIGEKRAISPGLGAAKCYYEDLGTTPECFLISLAKESW